MKKLSIILVLISFVQILNGQSKYQLEPFIYFNTSNINGDASHISSSGYGIDISGYAHSISTTGVSQSKNSFNLGLNLIKNSFGFKLTLGRLNLKGQRYFLGETRDESTNENLLYINAPLEPLSFYEIDLGIFKRYEIKKLEIDFSLNAGLLFDAMDKLEYNFNYNNQGIEESYNVKTFFQAQYLNFQTTLSYPILHNFSLTAGLDFKIGRIESIHNQNVINEETLVIPSYASRFNSSFNSLGINIGLKYAI